jgi:hypothetical protein
MGDENIADVIVLFDFDFTPASVKYFCDQIWFCKSKKINRINTCSSNESILSKDRRLC